MEFTGRHLIKMSRALKAMKFQLPALGQLYPLGVTKDTASEEQKAAAQEKLEAYGMKVIQEIILGIGDAENEVGDLFGALVGMSGNEFLDLPMREIMAKIKPIFEDAGFVGFFKQAVSAMK